MNETVWAMTTVSGRSSLATGYTETPLKPGVPTRCSADGEPFICRVWMRVGTRHTIYPTQNYMSRSQAEEVAMKFADALEATYFVSVGNTYL